MIEVPQINEIEISAADWCTPPVSIQQVVLPLVSENKSLKARLIGIEEQLRQNSQNSSKPPSQDGFGKKAPEVKEKSKKKRGGQPGHPGAQPKFYELSVGDVIENYVPTAYPLCEERPSGVDELPHRHQIWLSVGGGESICGSNADSHFILKSTGT